METGSKDRREEAAAELLLLARKLEDMQEGPMTQEAEDRIFAKIEASLDEELAPQAARPSRVRTGLSALGAYMPRPLIQRRADALAMMVEDVRAGRSVAARGELGAMLAAVGALQPLPAIEPNPSFVDWLEMRLTSAHAEAPTASRLAERIAALNSTLRNWRLQAGLASAAASVIALAIFALQGGPGTGHERSLTGRTYSCSADSSDNRHSRDPTFQCGGAKPGRSAGSVDLARRRFKYRWRRRRFGSVQSF